MAIIKKKVTNVGEFIQKLEFLNIAGGKVRRLAFKNKGSQK
jgi:hypothetical protein